MKITFVAAKKQSAHKLCYPRAIKRHQRRRCPFPDPAPPSSQKKADRSVNCYRYRRLFNIPE